MKKIYMVCPVRGVTQKETDFLNNYVKKLEEEGCEVHFPPRDADQTDPVGTKICETHAEAMSKADEVHMYYNPTSVGTIFDFGMAYLSRHISGGKVKIKLINRDKVEEAEKENSGKSFRKVMLHIDNKKD